MTFQEFTSLFMMRDFLMANFIALIATIVLNRKSRIEKARTSLSEQDTGQRYEYIIHCTNGIERLYADIYTKESVLLCAERFSAYRVEVHDRET